MNTKCNEKTHCHLMRVVELLLVILGLHPRKPLDELHYEELLIKIRKNERKLICVLKLKNIIFNHSSSAKIFEEEVTLPTSPTPISRGTLKILILLLRIFLILFSNQRHVSQKSR